MTIRELYEIADELGLLDQRLYNIRCEYAEPTEDVGEFRRTVTMQFWNGTQLSYKEGEDKDEIR